MDLKQADLSRGNGVGKNQLNPKVLQIKSTYVNWLKASVAVIIAVVIALSVSLLQLKKQHEAQQTENTRLLTQISELQTQVADGANRLNLISASTDSNQTKALSYIDGIQAKLGKINNYLSRRGLHTMSFKAPKAKADSKKNANLKLYAKFNGYLERLVNNVAAIPMGYPRVSTFTSFFGYRGNPFDGGRNEFHPGLDFRGQTGDMVKSTASGRVIFTGRAGGYGNCIRIQHAGDLQTWYGHLSHINVREGQRVTVGDVIGRVGNTGRSTGPHLHYEVRKDGKAVNPVQYLTLN
jgi:murein DD-endopeptidase MepM/ murein hydrolase activator NlpD